MRALFNRRRYMGDIKYDENSYIQDGLIFQLDGINKGATDGTWVDLIGNWVFSPNGNPVSTDKGWIFDGASWFSNSSVYPPGDYTIDVCCYQLPLAHAGSWDNGNFMLYKLGDRFFFQQRIKSVTIKDNTYTKYIKGKTVSLSFNQNTAFVNNNELSFSTSDFYSDPSVTEIGRFRSSYYKGTWYALRIYNRRLTETELKWNIMVDSKRFGFSL